MYFPGYLKYRQCKVKLFHYPYEKYMNKLFINEVLGFIVFSLKLTFNSTVPKKF